MLPLSRTDSSFASQVDIWVRDHFQTHGTQSWETLLQSLPGIDPCLVWDSVRRQGILESARVEHAVKKSVHTSTPCSLPTPHPLDYSWWFDHDTICRILSLVRKWSAPNEHVVLLGAPTIAQALADDTRKCSLVDADPLTVKKIGLGPRRLTVLANLLSEEVSVDEGAALVFADPPWYSDEIQSFLWAARQVCQLGGVVFLSVPPEGTRPGIVAEREALLSWTQTLGLEIEACEPSAIAYASPPFEQNAFLAASVPFAGTSWRRGDLIRFRCVQPVCCTRPLVEARKFWRERVIDDVRIRVTEGESRSVWADPTLKSLTEGDILPSVSRRDRRRQLANVWTSGNRVFACEGPGIVVTVLDAISSNQDAIEQVERQICRPLSLDESKRVESTEKRLRALIELESKEISVWRGQNATVDVVTS